MDIFDMFDHNGQETVFHGVHGAALARLIEESEDGKLHLYGRSVRDESDIALEYEQDGGYLYVTHYGEIELSANEFAGDDGLILVLGARKPGAEVQDGGQPREHVICLDEWEVIGALRPVFSEDGEFLEEEMEVLSVEEILSGE
jgi:hypothetical protein